MEEYYSSDGAVLDDADRREVDRRIKEFRRAWLQHPAPALHLYVPAAGSSLRNATLVQLIAADLKYRWRSMRGVLTEFYLDQWKELLPSQQDRESLLRAECLARSTYCDDPTADELRTRFPSMAARIDLDTIAVQARDLRTRESIDRKGRYFLLRKVGQGGMGIVYEALDRQRNERVALKILPEINPSRLYYFKREFRALAEVVHRNLASVYELHADSDQWFLTMQFVEGVDLRSFVRRNLTRQVSDAEVGTHGTKQSASHFETPTELWSGSLRAEFSLWQSIRIDDFDGVCNLLIQLAEGVETLHDAGILHRDLKPSNVMVKPDGQLKILDFGLITHLQSPDIESAMKADEPARGSGSRFATDLSVVGTFAYMSPEQASGQVLTECSDWYAVGLILFEALTGRLPYVGAREQVLEQKLSVDAPSVKDFNNAAPDDLCDLCAGLLLRDPTVRADGSTINRVLKEHARETGLTRRTHRVDRQINLPFVGRKESLEQLSQAFSHVDTGGAATVHVSGPSGAGKTRLIRHFLKRLSQRRDALVLAGRCYENESVPYKAIDALVDALCVYLAQQSPTQLEPWLPDAVGSLAVMFPVLNRVRPIAESSCDVAASYSAIELRRQAFAAMRELLIRISKSRPLVLFIDDLQWGDTDSAGVLSELIRPPDPPRLLLIAGYRNERLESNSCVQAMVEASSGLGIDNWNIEVGALSESESEQLARQLIGESEQQKSMGQRIAKESQGTPFFILELAQHVRSGLDLKSRIPSTQVELDEVLWHRVQELPGSARELLEVIALSGRPLRIRHAIEGAGLDLGEHDALAYLRAGHFVQGQGPTLDDEIGVYHDRIRESVVSHLDDQQRRRYHDGLATTFESSDDVDPERIAEHFAGAGHLSKAGSYFALAADQAADALAFNRAARLYQLAINHMSLDENERRAMQTKLGDALANAGRGVEAARTYQSSIDGSSERESLELQRRAAFQYCISGYVDDGRAALDSVLRQIGLRLPTTPTRALSSLLMSRSRLRLRGLRFRQRDAADVPQRERDRIDFVWSAAAGLSMFDVLQGADFQTRHCLLALDCGEPFRLARALSWEGAHVSNIGGSNWPRTQRLLDLAKSLSDQVDDPYAGGFWELSSGIAEFTNGRWSNAHAKLQRAQTTLRENCINVAWEIGTAQAFDMWALLYMGRIAEMGREATMLTREARERGDLYAATTLRAFAQPIGLLVHGDVDHCIELVESALQDWTRKGFHVQHIVALMCMTYLDLYRGRADSAYERIQQQWSLAKKSHLLRVQVLRSFLTHLRARCSLAYAEHSGQSARLLRDAAGDAKRIDRENMPYCKPHSQHILAAVAARTGDKQHAIELLDRAIQGYTQCEMTLFATVVKRRKGELLGGQEGRDLIQASTQWMRT